VEARETVQRFDLDLAHAFPRDPQLAADLLERARVGFVETVAEDDHAAVAVGKRPEGIPKGLRTQAVLDELVRKRAVGGNEITNEDRS